MNKEDIDKRIDLHSEEFQEVLGAVPSWILRYGITVLGAIVLIIFIGSAIFKYPEIITSSMTLTGSTPPVSIVARTSGKLQELNVKDKEEVKAGAYLGVIENSAKTEDILFLKEYLRLLNNKIETQSDLPPKNLNLGPMQAVYSSFYMSLFEYIEFKKLNYYPSKIEMMKERIHKYEIRYKNLSEHKQIVDEQLALNRKQYQRDSVLNKKGVISSEELEGAKNEHLQGRLSSENISRTLEESNIQITQIKESLLDTEYEYIEKKNLLETQIKTYIDQLQTEILTWEINYAFISPIDGVVNFANYWSPNQNVTSGENIFNIIPNDSGDLLGKALLPISRSGKVAIGQKVNIRFENFPDNEFGLVKGRVKNISLVPSKDDGIVYYVLEISLPDGLKTTYKKDLPYLPEMMAQADIVTDDISLLERFLMPLRKVWKEGMDD